MNRIEERFIIPDTEEEATQKKIEELLEEEKQLMYQRYLAPDLTDG